MARRAAIVTWTSYRNFGTYLQAYALQHIVRRLGYQTRVLDDSSIVAGFSKKRFSPLRWLGSQPWICPSRARFIRRRQSSIAEYDAFRKKHIDIDSQWNVAADRPSGYDVYIAGSDQIWSPNVPFSDYYYLAFADGRKTSYAPSFGASEIPDMHLKKIAPMISDFDSLSVREPVAASRIEECIGLKAQVVADPVLLVEPSGWDSLLAEDGVMEEYDGDRYALCYLLTYNTEYVSYVRRYCSGKGLKLKVLAVNDKMTGIGDEDVYTGPSGFIDAIRKSDVVFTDSFHGSIFSVLYRKNLLIFKRFASDSMISQNSRVEFLVQRLGLSGRLVDASGLNDEWDSVAIDYDRVNEEVESFRAESLDYIKSML